MVKIKKGEEEMDEDKNKNKKRCLFSLNEIKLWALVVGNNKCKGRNRRGM